MSTMTVVASDQDNRVSGQPRGLDRQLERLDTLYRRGAPTVLVGPTGVGKTTLVSYFAAQTVGDVPIEQVVGSRDLTVADLVGRWHLTSSGSRWVDGPLTRAVKQGFIFYFDELGTVDETITKSLNPLLDHRRQLVIPAVGKVIDAAPGFWFVGSYNPGYGMNARGFTPDFRQRLRFVTVPYLPARDEALLLTERTGASIQDATFLVSVAAITRTKLRHAVPEGASTRVLLAAAEDLADGMPRHQVVHDSILMSLTDDHNTRMTCLRTFETEGLLTIAQLQRIDVPEVVDSLNVPEDSVFDDEGDDDHEWVEQ